MDDCGDYEILPGIVRDDETSFEFRKYLNDKLDEYCESWKFTNYWMLQDVQLQYFDVIYCPYTYHIKQPQEDLYAREFNPNYIQLDDPYFTALLELNSKAIHKNTRTAVFLVLGEQIQTEISLNLGIGIGQFLPACVVNTHGILYSKKSDDRTLGFDGQFLREIYEGNSERWYCRGDLEKTLEKCPQKDWMITEVNDKFTQDYTCVSTLDVFQRLMLVIDLCKNIDFYVWLGNMTDMWLLWPEVCCEGLNTGHLKDLETDETNMPFERMLKDFRLLRYVGGLKRHNVYLGCNTGVLKEALPFYTEVCNGVFTLSRA